MSATANEGSSGDNEKPAIFKQILMDDVKFPPFPAPTDGEFEEDIGDEERSYYKQKFADLNTVKTMRLHCSACDRHLGSSTRNECRMRAHPMLRTLVCHTCHNFYNSGEFEKGDDGSELYCRWCGQGGQVYCCSNCPHVFCAKCIKRNLGVPKIKEIENTDDWKCFKCNSRCLWDLRAMCWALLRYCDLKNKITYKTEDPILREAYQKDCAEDHTDCCKNKGRRKEKNESAKKKEEPKKELKPVIPKLPSTIQVKKFASINIDEAPKEKKPIKRPANMNENTIVFMKNPIAIAPPKLVSIPPVKKPRMPVVNPIRFAQDRKMGNTYTRIRPKPPTMPIPLISNQFNGFSTNSYPNFANMDTINLSLESLTQGLDMSTMSGMSGGQDDSVVCTPDFPLEALCEVTDNNDDDVQCITPAPTSIPKVQMQHKSSPLETSLPDMSSDNIVQMTENDVTVNAVTGGLKFRVDPQTLSSNKMYRLPDGRIFAIKANPSMPGGYSATIVAVTETGLAKPAPKGATYAAKLSAVSSSQTSTPIRQIHRNMSGQGSSIRKNTPNSAKVTRGTDTSSREYDLHVPVEWYRFNLEDAVDALEYSLQRLYKLKKDATCRHLRTRSVEEMRNLHSALERLLNTSATRFNEIKDNLNKEFKQFIIKKTGGIVSDEDDDDVEILADLDDNDDPIFIDENSVESNINDLTCHEGQEVDLTGVGSSDHNDSAEKSDITSDANKIVKDVPDVDNAVNNSINEGSNYSKMDTECYEIVKDVNTDNNLTNDKSENKDLKDNHDDKNNKTEENAAQEDGQQNGETGQDEVKKDNIEGDLSKEDEKKVLINESETKTEDIEMSEEMIETLLKEDTADSILSNKATESQIVESR